MQDVKFIEANPDLCNEIEEFFSKSDKGFYEYEYRGYLPEKSVFTCAIAGGRIVGTQAVMPYRLNVNGISMLTARSERTLVDKSFRGGKIFPQLMNLCAEIAGKRGMQFIWGFTRTNKPLKKQGFLYKEGYCEHALIGVRPWRFILSCILKRDKAMLYALILAPSKLIRLAMHCISSCFINRQEQVTVQTQIRREDDYTKLYKNIKADSNVIWLERDNEFCSWLLEKTHRSYMTVFAYRKGELTAYAYIDLTDPHIAILKDVASIDFISLSKVIEYAMKELYKKKIAFLHAAYNVKNVNLKKLARQLIFIGFIPVKRRGGFVVRPLNYIDINILDDISAWYITPIWSDLYKGER